MVTVWHNRERDQRSVQFRRNKPIYDVFRITSIRLNFSLGKQIAICIADSTDDAVFYEWGEAESKRSQRSLMNSLYSVHYVDACLEEFSGEPKKRFTGGSQSSSGSITLEYLNLESIFKVADLAAQGRLSHMEPACSRRDCTLLGNRDNALEMLEFEMIVVAHGHAPRYSAKRWCCRDRNSES